MDALRDIFRYSHNGENAGSMSVDDNYGPAQFQQYGSGAALSRAVAASPQMQEHRAGQAAHRPVHLGEPGWDGAVPAPSSTGTRSG